MPTPHPLFSVGTGVIGTWVFSKLNRIHNDTDKERWKISLHRNAIRSMQLFSGMYRTGPIILEIASCRVGSGHPDQHADKNGGAVFELAPEWAAVIS